MPSVWSSCSKRYTALAANAAIAVLSVVGCGVAGDASQSTSPTEQRRSALTPMSRMGWVASASTTGGADVAANAIDANGSTRWRTSAAQATNQWFQVDMSSPRTFTEIRLDASGASNEFPRSYKVQVANDNVSWGTAPAIATGSGTSAVTTIAFAPQLARFVRITLAVSNNAFWSVHEFNVYGTTLSRSGWTASASSTNGANAAGNALDGGATTRWSSAAAQTSQWFKVDMKAAQTFNQIVLDAGTTTGNFPRGYAVFVSNDDINWGVAVATGTGSSAFMVVAFPFQNARYIRIDQIAANVATWSIQELNVEGQPTVSQAQPRVGWVATASSTNGGNGAANAVDGSSSTRWSSAGAQTGQWFQIDMLTTRNIDNITLDAGTTTNNFPRGYSASLSNDGTNWGTPVASGTGSTALVTINLVPMRTARFIRISQTTTNSTPWSIQEINVIGSALSRPGWVASSSSINGTNVASNAIDASAATRWSSAGAQTAQWFQVDMGTAQVFNQLTLDAGGGTSTNFPRAFSVSVSNDGTIWQTPFATGTGSGQLTTINFPNQTARFIRISQTASNSTTWSIEELNVARIAAQCDSVPDGTGCDDGDLCTAQDFCVAGVCKSPMTACAPVPTISFYQSFSQGTTVDIGRSQTLPQVSRPFVPATGIFGPAISGGTSFDIAYATSDNVSPTNIVFTKPGSVSMWVRPNSLFSATSLFLALDNNANLFFAVEATPTVVHAFFGQQILAESSVPWVPDDRWHLIVVNWSRTAVGVSVDGQPMAVTATSSLLGVPFGPNKGSVVYAGGGDSANPDGHARDELLILSRPMTNAEIQWYWSQRTAPQTGPNPAVAFFSGSTTTCTIGDDLDPCTAESCTPATGMIQRTPLTNSVCNDRNACTQADVCQAGTCVGGPALPVDDSNPCTADSCDPMKGAVQTNVADGTACADSTACGGTKACLASVCACRGQQQLTGYLTTEISSAPVVGPVPASTPIHMTIGLPPTNAQQLDAQVQQVSDPTSPSYRQYLTPAQFAATYGASATDYQALINWAQAKGLTVAGTYADRLMLALSGTASDFKRALFVNLNYRRRPDGSQFYAPDREPTIDLTTPVQRITGLDTFLVPRPAAGPPGAQADPIGPILLRQLYAGCTTLTGRGQSVGVASGYGYFDADIRVYEQFITGAGIAHTPVTLTNVSIDGFSPTPARNPDNSFADITGLAEATMDIDMIIAVAPEARIAVFEFGTTQDNALHMLDAMATTLPLSRQLTSSWVLGGDENFRAKFKQFALQGQSFSTGSGDLGAYSTPLALAKLWPSAKVETVTVVGGTLILDAPSPLLVESTWAGGGGGIVPGTTIPFYQQGLNTALNRGSSSQRNLPDVAMGAFQSLIFVTDATGASAPLGGGGTSMSTPLWAGFMALVNQQNQINGLPSVGFANPAVYAIAKTPSLYATSFTDIQDGSSIDLFSYDPVGKVTNDDGPSAFSAVPGYDLATGWGSPTCGLIDQLASRTPLSRSTLAISAGDLHTCALRSGRGVECWGENSAGQLGDGTFRVKSIPVPVHGLAGASAIATGAYHSCALLSRTDVMCWGSNGYGELGDGTTAAPPDFGKATPVQVQGLTGVQAIAAGFEETCALSATGGVKCWGFNGFGQLGDGTTTNRNVPVPVIGLSNAVAIAGTSEHNCALLADGTVKCWGRNVDGEIGDGTHTDRHSPVAVVGLHTAVAIAAGDGHTCALLSNTAVVCWGRNDLGQLGDGTTTPLTSPFTFAQFNGVVAITAGGNHSCATLSDGSVRCWGENADGQLGDGTISNRLTSVATIGVTGSHSVSAGLRHTCAVQPTGLATCWGFNATGQIGDGSVTTRLVPVPVVFP